MIRKMLLLSFLLLGCEGPVGPAGPQGPQGLVGPQGPTGTNMAFELFEGSITATVMQTIDVNTGGVFPGIVCYAEHSSLPGAWIQLNTDTTEGTGCGVLIVSTTTYQGRALVPVSMVNAGWTVRIILFWLP